MTCTTTYAPVRTDITIIRGDAWNFELDVSDTTHDLDGITFTAELSDSTDLSVADTRDADGLVTLSLTSVQTAAITSRVPLHWAVRRSDEITVIEGRATLR